MKNKPRNYRNNNKSERIHASKVSKPFRVVNGEIIDIKTVLLALIALTIMGCSWEQDTPVLEALTYEYQPFQAHTIKVEIIPTQDVEINYDEMLKEVNADYFNRYGIAVDMVIGERIQLNDKFVSGITILLPENTNKDGAIQMYIVPREVIKVQARAYASIFQNTIVLRESVQTSSTVAHEIGHLMGLKHIDEDNNVMLSANAAFQFDTPRDFNGEQVEAITTNIIEGLYITQKSSTNQIILD